MVLFLFFDKCKPHSKNNVCWINFNFKLFNLNCTSFLSLFFHSNFISIKIRNEVNSIANNPVLILLQGSYHQREQQFVSYKFQINLLDE